MNPRIIKMHVKGHSEKVRETDYFLWLMGRYAFDAQMVALAHFGAGLAGKKSQAEYPVRPYLQAMENVQQNGHSLSEEEKQKAVDAFFAKEKARRVNWKRKNK